MQRTELAELGEFGLIRHLTQGLPKHNDTTVLGVGDDAAIIAYPEGTETLVTTDLLLEGIHSDDPSALIGLPLIRLAGHLRTLGLDPLG